MQTKNKKMSRQDCCAIDQSDKKCVDLAYDDSKCGKLYQCCGAMHDAGLQAKCLSRVRECRKLGNAWDAIRPLKPMMNADIMFNDRPGYSTQGVLEKFSGSFQGLTLNCVLSSATFAFVVGILVKFFLKTEISTQKIFAIALLAALIRCMVSCL